MNELKEISTTNFNVDFTPATIEIKNYEKIEKAIDDVTEFYENTVYEEGDLKNLQQSHRELNKLRNGLDESRLKVKRKYNEPLKVFENDVKKLIGKIDEPLNEIKKQRDEILSAQEQLRAEALEDYIKQQIKDTKINYEEIEQKDSWTNKGVWTDKLNPRKPLKEEIEYEVNRIKEEKKKLLAERQILETFFNEIGVDPAGWISQLEYREATEIIQEYQRNRDEEKRRKKQQEKLERQRKEEQQRLEQEQNEAAEQQQETKVEEPANEPEEIDEMEEMFFEEPKITNTIEVTGTVEQLSKLNTFLIENDIKVVLVGD